MNSFKNKFKNSEFIRKITATIIVVFLGLLVGLIIMLITNPSNAFLGISKILSGGLSSFKTAHKISSILFKSTALIFTGLSIGVAYKVGLFNIGASGQFTMGIFGSLFAINTFIPFDMTRSFNIGYWLLAIVFGILFSLVTGVFIGIIKAYFNVNEVLSGIMINYIAMKVTNFYIINSPKIYDPSTTSTANLPKSVTTPNSFLSILSENSYLNLAFIFAIIVAIFLMLFFKYTKYGKELQMVGKNKYASKFAGISQNKAIIVSLTLASVLAGLGGSFFILSSANGASQVYQPIDAIRTEGFDGIVISLIGFSNPVGIIFSSIFINYLRGSADYLQLIGYQKEIVEIIISVILYFIAFSSFIYQINYKKIFGITKDEVIVDKDFEIATKKDLKYAKEKLKEQLKLENKQYKQLLKL